MKRLIIAVLLLCSWAVGQVLVAPISGRALDQYGQPIPYAQIRVCSVTSTGVPCTPLASIFQDYGLTVAAANPYSADQYGNYTVYAGALPSPNLYVIQQSANQGLTWNYVQSGPGTNDGVTQIVAGTNVTISPSGGTGAVTINASGGGGGGIITSVGPDFYLSAFELLGYGHVNACANLYTEPGAQINQAITDGLTLYPQGVIVEAGCLSNTQHFLSDPWMYLKTVNVLGEGNFAKVIVDGPPSGTWLIDSTWVQPSEAQVEGHGDGSPVGQNLGLTIKASDSFTSSTGHLVALGADGPYTCTGNNPCIDPPEGTRLEGVNFNGQSPDGLVNVPVGVYDGFCQNFCGLRRAGFQNFTSACIDIENGITNSGSLNHGPWDTIQCQVPNTSNSNNCIQYGQHNTTQATVGGRDMSHVMCQVNNGPSGTRPLTIPPATPVYYTDATFSMAGQRTTSADVVTTFGSTVITSATLNCVSATDRWSAISTNANAVRAGTYITGCNSSTSANISQPATNTFSGSVATITPAIITSATAAFTASDVGSYAQNPQPLLVLTGCTFGASTATIFTTTTPVSGETGMFSAFAGSCLPLNGYVLPVVSATPGVSFVVNFATTPGGPYTDAGHYGASYLPVDPSPSIINIISPTQVNIGAAPPSTVSNQNLTITYQPQVAVAVDTRGNGMAFRDFHFEGFVTAYELGASTLGSCLGASCGGATGVTIDQVNGQMLQAHMETVVDLSANNPTRMYGDLILNPGGFGGTTNYIIWDHNTPGGVTAGSSSYNGTAIYARDQAANGTQCVFSTNPTVFSTCINMNAATATNISTNGTANQFWGMNGTATAQGWFTPSVPAPSISTLGGVFAKDCSTFGASYVVQKINTDGSETCVSVSGGSGMVYPAAGIPVSVSGTSWAGTSLTEYGSAAGLATTSDPGAVAEVPMVANGTHGMKPSASGALGTGAFAAAYVLPSTVVQTGQANTYSTGLQDFSSATMKQPSTYTVGSFTITNPGATGTLCASGSSCSVTALTGLTSAATPNAAGGTTLGSAALPFSSAYIGGAATNNFQVTGTATAARTVTMPDASTNLLISGYAHTISGPTAARTFTFPDASASVAVLGTAQTFTAGPTFNTTAPTFTVAPIFTAGLVTTTAGTGTIGSATKWFNSLYMGTGATYYGQLTGTPTANRTWTLPDASTAFEITGYAHTISGPTAARTVTWPDANFSAARIDAAQTFVGSQTFSATTNQIITGAGSNLTTNNYPASSGAITLTYPNTTEYMVGANSDTTTTHVLHATAVAGVFNSAAIASADLPAATSSAAGAVIQIANTSFTTSTSAVGGNTCSGTTQVAMTGVTTSMTFGLTASADTSAATGWGSSGGLVLDIWPTAGYANIKICNQTAVSITPTAVTFNISAR